MKLLVLQNSKVPDQFLICSFDENRLLSPAFFGDRANTAHYLNGRRNGALIFKKPKQFTVTGGVSANLLQNFAEITIKDKRFFNKARKP